MNKPQLGQLPSLRDLFAMHAMHGIVMGYEDVFPRDASPDAMQQEAQWAYNIADAMLKARSSK